MATGLVEFPFHLPSPSYSVEIRETSRSEETRLTSGSSEDFGYIYTRILRPEPGPEGVPSDSLTRSLGGIRGKRRVDWSTK